MFKYSKIPHIQPFLLNSPPNFEVDQFPNADKAIKSKSRSTPPELDVFAEKELADTQELVLDFADLEYISSAGLRVLLKLQKVMNKKGSMKLIHVGEVVKEVFEITGFTDILTIE